MKILGVDPGTWRTGVGLIATDGNQYRLLYCHTIHIRNPLPLAERLQAIYQNLLAVLEKFKPDILALEDIFYGKNIPSMVKIGEARACAMLAASHHGISVKEYPPARVKQAVTGSGRASKQQVQRMIKTLLGLKEIPPPDSADALALAVCHAHHGKDRLFTLPSKKPKNILIEKHR